MKYSKDLPKEEKRHFMKCDCGEYFDMRDLEDVFNHLHKYNGDKVPVQYSHSIKVGEPVAYTKKGKGVSIN